jgi:predicted transcriptional regulator
MTPQTLITEQLRQAILNARVSRYRIAKETGVTEAALSRFVKGTGGLSLASVDKLGLFLDVCITRRAAEEKKEQ